MTLHLSIDIGNSNSDFAIYKRGEQVSRWKCRTKDFASFAIDVQVERITVSSVVKSRDEEFKKILFSKTGVIPHFVSLQDFPGINWGKHFLYPHEIGADILVGVCAASKIYPRENVLVFDFGTATTLVGLSAKQEFLGGLIIPGLELQAKSLSDNTDQLSRYGIEAADRLFGATTKEAINSGIYYAHVGAIKEYMRLAGADYLSIATGGAAHLFVRDVTFDMLAPDLILDTLADLGNSQ